MPVLEIPDGLTHFKVTVDGEAKEFGLDLVEASQAFNGFAKNCAEQGLSNFEYLDQFVAWVKDRTGVQLVKGQALWLVRKMDEEFARGKGEGGPGPS